MTTALAAHAPHYPTRAERLADGLVHAIALGLFTFAVGAALGFAILRGGLGMAAAISVYAVCVITMIGCSMAYNLTEKPKRRAWLRRLDHAAIFLMIAGTYTPFTTLRFEGGWALWMTIGVWTLAVIGILGKVFVPDISKRMWVPFYLLLGWMVVIAFGPLSEGVSLAGIILLAVGGAIYTLGVGVYVWQRLPFRRAIWHGFVVTGAGVHYSAVLTGVVFAPIG